MYSLSVKKSKPVKLISVCEAVHIYSPKKAEFSQISSKLCGVNISEHLKMIWKQRCKHDIVKSLNPQTNNHNSYICCVRYK
jgi:hypothetical protein